MLREKIKSQPNLSSFRIDAGTIAKRRIWSFTPPKDTPANWNQQLAILTMVDTVITSGKCRELPFDFLFIGSRDKKGVMATSWQGTDLLAIHPLRSKSTEWEAALKLRGQTSYAKAK
jgi:hypothetical protein